MMIPTMAQTPLVGYRLIVIALIATGFFSFGLWGHHMFTTGIPGLSLAFFSAASMAVSIPSGIQVFSWIATMAAGRQRFRINVPSLFVLGFLFIFVLGGLTGVMVAVVPFDFQAHDSYFVVAHFHYVLVGGMVFPLFATFYYWAPVVSSRMLSERPGRWAFWLMFIGFNTAFFPMHITGLSGMPRRVWSYPSNMGWDILNSISTLGAFVMATGVLVFIIDLVRNFRVGEGGPNNPWNAGTLEFLPNSVYSTRSIPHVTSREPVWDQPGLAEQVEQGLHYLPNAPTGGRETLITSAIEARPQYVLQMPGPSWTHLIAAAGTAAFFLLLTIKQVNIALACGAVAIIACLIWTWQLDGPSQGDVNVARNLRLPTYMTGPLSHSWWAMVVLMLVAASLYLSYVFSYLYLWTVSPEVWAPAGSPARPLLAYPAASAVLLIIGMGLMVMAGKLLPQPGRRSFATGGVIALAAAAMVASLCLEIWGHLETGLNPASSSYAAMVYMASVLQGQIVFAVLIMCLFAAARLATAQLDSQRRITFDNAALLYHYVAAQGLFGLLLVHGFPRLLG